MMNSFFVVMLSSSSLFVLANMVEAQAPSSDGTGCLSCHQGIKPIREPDSMMMREIIAGGQAMGDPAGCVVCHGGDPAATSEEQAHQGPDFYSDPGSPWVNATTCGRCHQKHVRAQWNSLMMT